MCVYGGSSCLLFVLAGTLVHAFIRLSQDRRIFQEQQRFAINLENVNVVCVYLSPPPPCPASSTNRRQVEGGP